MKATISQILSSISNIQCALSEPIPQKFRAVPGFSKIFETFAKVCPVAILIGTHKDEVVCDYDDTVKKLNESLKSITKAFKIVAVPSDSQTFFPVDNMNGIDADDIAPIRHFIEKNLLKNHFKDTALLIRPNWLLFGVTLRNEYRMIAKMSDCIEIGKVLQMDMRMRSSFVYGIFIIV